MFGWKQYSSSAGGWCWNNGNGPTSFPCAGGGQEYSCHNGQCQPDPGGIHPTLAACQAVCVQQPVRKYCVNCEKQVMSYYPGMPNNSQTECPPGFVDIGTSPNPQPGPCIECINGNCVQGARLELDHIIV